MKNILLVGTLILFSFSAFSQQVQSIYAGPDQTILAGQIAHLEAEVINVPYVIWNTSGTGTFTQRYSPVSDYIPSKMDIKNGKVRLTIHNRRKPTMRSSLLLTISKCGNTIDIAISADTVCGFDSGVTYDVFANATGSRYYTQWTTSGTGFFYDEYALNTTYEPSLSDLGSGRVLLTVTIFDSVGLCAAVSDSMLLKLNDPARIDIQDEDINICGNEPVFIDGNISGTATTVYWTTNGTGTFTENPGRETTYIPSLQDRLTGGVTVYGRTNDPAGPCPARSDYLNINFYGPAVDAGENIVVCGRSWGGEIPLNATIGSTGGDITWTSNGSGGFDDPYIPNPTYYYDGADVNQAFVELYATVDNYSCATYTDTVVVWLQAAPRLEFPEPSVYGCATDPVYANVYLYGHASSGTWTTTGSGTFADPNSTYTEYYPSAEDGINGCVDLIFTSNDPQGPCGPTSGSMSACFYDCSGEFSASSAALQLFPNPAQHTLELQAPVDATTSKVLIKDMTGNRADFSVSDSNHLDISTLLPGLYTIEIITEKNRIYRSRFIKK
jgi:hypothetical protein